MKYTTPYVPERVKRLLIGAASWERQCTSDTRLETDAPAVPASAQSNASYSPRGERAQVAGSSLPLGSQTPRNQLIGTVLGAASDLASDKLI
jgi:hypothetical protein